MAFVKDITCREAVALANDYLEGALSKRDRRRLERHLKACDGCSAYLSQMRTVIELTGKVDADDLSDETLSGLVDLFDRYQSDPEAFDD